MIIKSAAVVIPDRTNQVWLRRYEGSDGLNVVLVVASPNVRRADGPLDYEPLHEVKDLASDVALSGATFYSEGYLTDFFVRVS